MRAVDAPPHLFLGIRRKKRCAGCRLPNLVVFLVTFPSHALIIFLLSSVSLFFCLIIFLPLSLCLAPRAPIHLQKNKRKAKGTRCLGFSKVIHAATRRQTRQMAAATMKGGGGVPRPMKSKLSYCMMHTATVTNNQDAHTPIGELTARVYGCLDALVNGSGSWCMTARIGGGATPLHVTRALMSASACHTSRCTAFTIWNIADVVAFIAARTDVGGCTPLTAP